MQNTVYLHFVRNFLVRINQRFCLHRWSYNRSVTLVGRRCAEHVCMKCGKLGHIIYRHDYEIKNGKAL